MKRGEIALWVIAVLEVLWGIFVQAVVFIITLLFLLGKNNK